MIWKRRICPSNLGLYLPHCRLILLVRSNQSRSCCCPFNLLPAIAREGGRGSIQELFCPFNLLPATAREGRGGRENPTFVHSLLLSVLVSYCNCNVCLWAKWIDKPEKDDDSFCCESLKKKYLGRRAFFSLPNCLGQFWVLGWAILEIRKGTSLAEWYRFA